VAPLTLHAIREPGIRRQADSATTKMLDLWKTLCVEKIGQPIEVMAYDRREYPFHGVNTHVGKFNSSIPQPFQDTMVLMLLLESVKPFDLMIVTHELGHWVLRLQGQKIMMNAAPDVLTKKRDYSAFPDVCTHPALHKLVRSLGHDTAKFIDKKVAADIGLLKTKSDPASEKAQAEEALYYADDLINCSSSNRTGLERKLSSRMPKTAIVAQQIVSISQRRDITKIEEALPFSKDIIQELNLLGNWYESGEVDLLKRQIAEARLRTRH